MTFSNFAGPDHDSYLLCADDRDGLVCALYSGHPTDRGPGHVWVAVEELIAAGTVAWRAASTSGTTPSENVLHVLATPEPAPADWCCPCCDAPPGHKPCPPRQAAAPSEATE